MAENPTFQIPRDVIEPIIQANVAAAITEALGEKGVFIETAVRQILFMKVGDDGKPTSYSGVPFVQWVMMTAVRRAIKEAIEENMCRHKDAIKMAIAKELGLVKTSPLAKQLINGMVEAMTHPDVLKYRINVVYDGK